MRVSYKDSMSGAPNLLKMTPIGGSGGWGRELGGHHSEEIIFPNSLQITLAGDKSAQPDECKQKSLPTSETLSFPAENTDQACVSIGSLCPERVSALEAVNLI